MGSWGWTLSYGLSTGLKRFGSRVEPGWESGDRGPYLGDSTKGE